MLTSNDQLLLHINKHISKLDLKLLYLMNLENLKDTTLMGGLINYNSLVHKVI